MVGEWRETTLDQLGRIVTGKTPPATQLNSFGRDIPFVTPTDFDGRRIINTTARYLSDQGARIVGASRIPARAVMVSCIGSDMGKAAIAAQDCITNQQINSIVVDSDGDPMFIYYNLSTRKAEIRTAASGSAQPILNKSAFGQIGIRLPPLREQGAIAHILGTLDDKIELNRRMNETLEAMAHSLFKSWFVDFDPVRTKTEGRDSGLPKSVADLFPDSFQDSDSGKIPTGWNVGPLDQIASIVMGLSPKGDSYNSLKLGIPLINGPVEFGRYFPAKTKWTSSPTRLSQAGDLILCVRGSTTGKRVIADDIYCLGRGVCAMRAVGETRTFLYQTLDSALERLLAKTTGSVFPNLSAPDIKNLPVIIPPREILRSFETLAGPLTSRRETNEKASNTLTALRDTLLPKLISGEIRLTDAERFAGAH